MEIHDSQSLKEIAIHFYDRKRFVHAIEFFSKALKYDSDDAEAYNFRGLAYFQILEIEKAIDDIKTALIKDETLEEAYANLADIYLQKYDYQQSEYYGTQALMLNKESISTKKLLAFTKNKLKKFDDAIKLCNEILSFDSNRIWTLKLKMEALIGNAKFEEALEVCLDLPKDEYEPIDRHQHLGYLYGKLGNAKLAIEHLNIAIKLDAYDAYSLNNLGYAHYLNKEYGIALDLVNESLRLDCSNAYAYKNKAIILIALGDKTLAMQSLEMAQFLCYSDFYDEEVNRLIKES